VYHTNYQVLHYATLKVLVRCVSKGCVAVTRSWSVLRLT